MDELRKDPPTTVKEMGIHLLYVGNEIHRLTALLEEYNKSFVPRSELDLKFASLQKRADDNAVSISENKIAIARLKAGSWVDILKNALLIVTTFTALYAIMQLVQGV